jgi:Bacterial toxin 28
MAHGFAHRGPRPHVPRGETASSAAPHGEPLEHGEVAHGGGPYAVPHEHLRGLALSAGIEMPGHDGASDAESHVPGGTTLSSRLGGSAADHHARDVHRVDYICDRAQKYATETLSSLAPGYMAARDALDPAAVQELGTRLIGAVSGVRGSRRALDKIVATVPRMDVAGSSVAADHALDVQLESARARKPLIDGLEPVVVATAAAAMTPQRFHGHQVAGRGISIEPGADPRGPLSGELNRTLAMLQLVVDLRTQLTEQGDGFDPASLAAARARLERWRSRPLDLAFLRAALGPLWDVLDATTGPGPREEKPSETLANATAQAQHTGWLGDIGLVDVDEISGELRVGGRESAEYVMQRLMTADDTARARLLVQLRERGLLDALCAPLPWAYVKQLHDSLATGHFGGVKQDLQRYFLGSDKFGPDLGHQNDRKSLHKMLRGWGTFGKALDIGLDVGTFGFNSSYGNAYDAHAQGLTTDDEYHRAQLHTVLRTAEIATVSLATGGLADKAVRGGAETVSIMRAVAGGAAGGSVGAMSGLATSDSYGVWVSGDQKGFSSPEAYMEAALLGGAIGGAAGGVTQGLSPESARYAKTSTPEAPVEPATGGAEGVAPEPADLQRPRVPETSSGDQTTATDKANEHETKGKNRDLGLRPQAREALESLENVKRDPIGDVNREPNKNHYKAARKEADGEVVARRPDGQPYSHIRDLQQGYRALDRIRRVLERELEKPPSTITERGASVLRSKYSEVQAMMSRLKGFLDRMGYAKSPPFHEWPPGS